MEVTITFIKHFDYHNKYDESINLRLRSEVTLGQNGLMILMNSSNRTLLLISLAFWENTCSKSTITTITDDLNRY